MKTKKKKIVEIPAVIYARYSSTSQSEQSIDGQLRDCHDFAKREGYRIVGEYIGEWLKCTD